MHDKLRGKDCQYRQSVSNVHLLLKKLTFCTIKLDENSYSQICQAKLCRNIK